MNQKILLVFEQDFSLTLKHEHLNNRDIELLLDWQASPDPSELVRGYQLASSIELLKV